MSNSDTPPAIPPLDGHTSGSSGKINRRTTLKGLAWATPVVVATVTAPAAVASTVTPPPPLDLAVTSVTTAAGTPFSQAAKRPGPPPVYQDNQTFNGFVTLQNVGSDPIPPGSTFTITYPASASGQRLFDSGPNIVTIEAGTTTPGATTGTVSAVGPETVTNGAVSRTFIVGVPIPAGSVIALRTQIRAVDLAGGTVVANRAITVVAAVPSGSTDVNLANNSRSVSFSIDPAPAIARSKGGGTWNAGAGYSATAVAPRNLTFLLNAPVDLSGCSGNLGGSIVSITARWTHGTVTQTSNFGVMSLERNVAQPGGTTSDAFTGTFTLANYPGGSLLGLTIVYRWTSGCGIGDQTFNWGTTTITPRTGAFTPA